MMSYLAFITLALAALCAWWLGRRSPAALTPLRIDGDRVGMNVGNTGGDLSMLDSLATTGTGWVRLEQDWPGDVVRAEALGMNVLMLLKGSDSDALIRGVRAFTGVPAIELLNEPNNPWWDGVTAAEYAALCRAVKPHLAAGQLLVGPAVATDLDGALEYVVEVLRLAPGCLDVISIHAYGSPEDVAAYIAAVPGSLPVWLTETAYGPDQTQRQQSEQLGGVLRLQERSPRWALTMPYHWHADRRFPIVGTATEALLREVIR